jgi:hypothetical protein
VRREFSYRSSLVPSHLANISSSPLSRNDRRLLGFVLPYIIVERCVVGEKRGAGWEFEKVGALARGGDHGCTLLAYEPDV